MRQRLGIAAALLRSPRLLLLDEPATGLDPAGMRDMRALVRRLADQGMTVVLSSHLMSEVEELCNRVAIISRGKIIREGALSELLAGAAGSYRLEVSDPQAARAICSAQGLAVEMRGAALVFSAGPAEAARLSIALGKAEVGITELHAEGVSLEHLFLSLTEGSASKPPVAPEAAS